MMKIATILNHFHEAKIVPLLSSIRFLIVSIKYPFVTHIKFGSALGFSSATKLPAGNPIEIGRGGVVNRSSGTLNVLNPIAILPPLPMGKEVTIVVSFIGLVNKIVFSFSFLLKIFIAQIRDAATRQNNKNFCISFIHTKYKFLFLPFFIFFNANATTYYVSAAGNDNSNGTTTGTSFLTITKALSVVAPGDNILLNKGDFWNEKLVPITSGTAGNVITIGSYGTGAKPLITGYQAVIFADAGSNIWTSTFSNSVPSLNNVYINGAIRAKGRYPNGGYLTFTSHLGTTQITGSLTGNYTGGEVVIRNTHFTIDHLRITSQIVGTINFNPGTYYALTNNNGYFIQNIASVLDTLNEWSVDSTTKIISVYATSQPTVKASSIDTLIYVNAKNYLTFDGLQFDGANTSAFTLNSTSHVTITNCDILNSGANGIEGQGNTFTTISNNTIDKCWNDGICLVNFLTGATDNDDVSVTSNTISNTGTLAGMGKSRFQTYTGLEVWGDRSLIKWNRVTNTGYIGIYFYGDTCQIRNNYVDTFCYVKDDGGGIYTFSGAGISTRGEQVVSNIVKNGLTASAGTDEILETFGIYLDNDSDSLLVDSNTVSNVSRYGIFNHESTNITVTNNLLYDNLEGLGIDNTISGAANAKMIFKKNIVVSKATDFVFYGLIRVVPAHFLSLDTNYYYSQFDSTKIARSNNNFYSLAAWQALSSLDIHSQRKPAGVTAAAPILVSNSTTGTVVYPLTGTYYDMKGTAYINTISLQSFGSALLFKGTVDLVPPEPPLNNKFKKSIKYRVRLQ